MTRFVFGPVPSRRLGFSLGVDVIPSKYCSYDCIYCQIGKTTDKEITRKSFFDPHTIIDEVAEKVKRTSRIDHISFSGSGEPTLNADIGFMIREVKKITSIPVSVITNGAMLYEDEVRRDLMAADVVLPSLDAVSEDLFRYVNRPHPALEVEAILNGLRRFRQEYTGKLWLEVMLMKNVNDDKEELKKFKKVIEDLNADKVQINTVVRPPTEEGLESLTREELDRACRFLGKPCEIICNFEKSVREIDEENWSQRVLTILKRRSLTLDDIVKITGVSLHKAKERLKSLENEGFIKSYIFDGKTFYLTP
ncbi:MAG TPA: radical SAM protein [Syntrophorhabdaceae bacterium]|nr:radical SAM protein [Syntrophorhabdaceae bacterium]